MIETREVHRKVRLTNGHIVTALVFLGRYWVGLGEVTAQVAEVLA